MDIGKYIKELLILHDCVILPGLGGFVANYRSAEINEILKIISPPSKSILFNRNLYHNDGLVIGYISGKTGMGYKDAEMQVQNYVEKIIKTTGSGTKFAIDELGFFIMDKEKKLQFIAEPGMNFLIESYSLHNVHFKEFITRAEKPVKSRDHISQGIPSAKRNKVVRRIVYTGIAASLLAAGIIVPLKTGVVSYSDLGLFKIKKDTYSTPVELNKEAAQTENIPVSTPEPYRIEIKQAEFHIIAGSFREFSNARELMKKMQEQGFETRILSAESAYFRVSVGSYADKDMAVRILSEVRQLPGLDSAWLLNN